MSATLQLNKKDKMLYVPLQFREYENFGLLDTGAIQSALSEAELRRILTAHPAALLQELPAPEFKVQIANGNIVPVRKQVLLRFFIGGKIFEETFMVLPTMGNILIGMSFFKKYSVTLNLANNIVKFPDITLQLRSVNGKFKNKLLELKTTQKTVIQPNQQVFVPVVIERDLATSLALSKDYQPLKDAHICWFLRLSTRPRRGGLMPRSQTHSTTKLPSMWVHQWHHSK